MHPFGPELRTLAAFVPPPGTAPASFDRRTASDHPEVTRYWHVAGRAQAACGPALASFQAWADRATITNLLPGYPASCYFRGRRGGELVDLDVFDPSTGYPGPTSLTIHIRRAS